MCASRIYKTFKERRRVPLPTAVLTGRKAGWPPPEGYLWHSGVAGPAASFIAASNASSVKPRDIAAAAEAMEVGHTREVVVDDCRQQGKGA